MACLHRGGQPPAPLSCCFHRFPSVISWSFIYIQNCEVIKPKFFTVSFLTPLCVRGCLCCFDLYFDVLFFFFLFSFLLLWLFRVCLFDCSVIFCPDQQPASRILFVVLLRDSLFVVFSCSSLVCVSFPAITQKKNPSKATAMRELVIYRSRKCHGWR